MPSSNTLCSRRPGQLHASEEAQSELVCSYKQWLLVLWRSRLCLLSWGGWKAPGELSSRAERVTAPFYVNCCGKCCATSFWCAMSCLPAFSLCSKLLMLPSVFKSPSVALARPSPCQPHLWELLVPARSFPSLGFPWLLEPPARLFEVICPAAVATAAVVAAVTRCLVDWWGRLAASASIILTWWFKLYLTVMIMNRNNWTTVVSFWAWHVM